MHTLKDRQWYPLSKGIRIYCISDLNEDAVLLADVNGRLAFNRTDASDMVGNAMCAQSSGNTRFLS